MKWLKDQLVYLLVAVFLCTGVAWADKPHGVDHSDSMWIGDREADSDTTVGDGDGDVYIEGTLEVDDAVDLDSTLNVEGAVTLQSTLSATIITGTATEFGTGTISATEIADTIRYVHLPLSNWVLETQGGGDTVGTGWTAITDSTTPGWELDDSVINLNFGADETSPVQQTVTVPADYASGGDFLASFTSSDDSPHNTMDFDVYVNTPSDGAGADTSATGQTPVSTGGITNTLNQVTLTIATDLVGIAAGDQITLRLWGGGGTGDKELKGDVLFRYNAIQ